MIRKLHHNAYRCRDSEETRRTPEHARAMDPATNGARAKLDAWQAAKDTGKTDHLHVRA